MMIEMTGVERSRLFPIILSEYNPAWPQWFAKEKERLVRLIDSLPKSEYVCLRQQTIPSNDRALLLKGYTSSGFAERVYHVHVRCHGDWDEPHFRDYLIAHPEAADAYAVLKRKLKERFEFDRDGYTNAKGEFIKAVTKRARNIAERMGNVKTFV